MSFFRRKRPRFRPPPKKSASPFFLLLLIAAFAVWFVWRSLIPTLPVLGEPPRLYSNQCQQDLTVTFLDAIEKAKHSVYLVMFGLNDPPILKALAKKGEENISCSIYYDPTASPNLHKSLASCETHPVRQNGLMHQKILILDEEKVFLGSANMTTASLRMHDNLVIGLANRKIAEFLQGAPYASGHLHVPVGGQEVDLWMLPDPKGNALSSLKKFLKSARKSIKIALFTFTHSSLVDELILAHRRGVDVTVVLDLYSALGASKECATALKQAGIEVRLNKGVELFHHKFALIDDQLLIAGSANWTKAAFMKNSDCLIALHDLLPEQKSFMHYLWKRIWNQAQVQSP